MADIYKRILDIQEDMGAIAKTQTTQGGGPRYNFRGIDDVMNAVSPLLTKHRVFAAPEVLEQIREERVSNNNKLIAFTRLLVKLTFYTDDGSNVSAVVVGEAMDSSDKCCTKAHSVAYRIGLLQILCIPTEETAVDVENDNHELSTLGEQVRKFYSKVLATVKGAASIEDIDKYKNAYEKKVFIVDGDEIPAEGVLTADERKTIAQAFDTRLSELESELTEVDR